MGTAGEVSSEMIRDTSNEWNMTKNNRTAAEIPATSSGVFCRIPVNCVMVDMTVNAQQLMLIQHEHQPGDFSDYDGFCGFSNVSKSCGFPFFLVPLA